MRVLVCGDGASKVKVCVCVYTLNLAHTHIHTYTHIHTHAHTHTVIHTSDEGQHSGDKVDDTWNSPPLDDQ